MTCLGFLRNQHCLFGNGIEYLVQDKRCTPTPTVQLDEVMELHKNHDLWRKRGEKPTVC